MTFDQRVVDYDLLVVRRMGGARPENDGDIVVPAAPHEKRHTHIKLETGRHSDNKMRFYSIVSTPPMNMAG